jgi:REP-associated tyrosine transposase
VTLPRCILPGTTWLLSRRTTRRFFLFRPDADGALQRIYLYCLAFAAHKYGILVHAAVLLSDHGHLVVTDPHGVLPDFLRDFHRLFAMCVKCHRAWDEEVWNKTATNCVELRTVDSVLDKVAYALANPVACGGVRYARDWPGVTQRVNELGRSVVDCERPDVPFLTGEMWPERIELAFVWPPRVYAELSGREARSRIAALLDVRERDAHAQFRKKGWSFLGAERCVRTSIYRRATTPEPLRDRVPTFAHGGDRDVRKRAIAERRAFRAAYACALELWRAGVADDAIFPAGTWWMRVFHGARCDEPPG